MVMVTGEPILVGRTKPRHHGAHQAGKRRMVNLMALIAAITLVWIMVKLAWGLSVMQPCCGYVGDTFVNLKTGKKVTPPKGAHQFSAIDQR